GIRDLTVTGVQTCALPIFTTTNDLPTGAGGGTATFNALSFSGTGYVLSGKAVVLGDPSVSGSGTVTAGSNLTDNIKLNVQLAGPAGTRQFITVGSLSTLTIS